MDPVSLVVGGLLAGAADGLKDVAGSAVRDAYERLRGLLRGRFDGNQPATTVLEQAEQDPQVWEQPLRKAVAETGAAEDPQVQQAAQRLMELLDAAGAGTGKYQVDARYGKGVQVGDHNRMENVF